ncbi:MAG: HlyC/CorC family transporter [Treponema sp.]|nr:HlyC/CorC family transporter [Treponema sp.]
MAPAQADTGSVIPLLAFSFLLILLSMTFSGTESAFLSINKLRVRFLHNKRNPRAMRVWKLLQDKERLINTLLVANNIVNISLSALLTYAALELFGSAGVGIATLVATVLLLVFGEITPKVIATHHPEAIAFFVAPLVELLEKFLYPLVLVFTSFSRFCLKLLDIDTQKKEVSFTEEEIKTLLDVGGEQGIFETSEKTMMRRVFKFTDLEAKDIMIPRKDIKALSITAGYKDIIEFSQRHYLSRFPIYREDIDDIVGVVYIKDLLSYRDRHEAFVLTDVMRPPLFILETKKMSSIQQMLRENRQSMAVVIDEYSGTYGILTTEDIVREIFGPIADDNKPYARRVEIKVSNADSDDVSGLSRLIDINEQLGTRLDSRRSETIGGYIVECLGHIPQVGEGIVREGFRFSVKAMDDKRVAEVHFERQESRGQQEQQEPEGRQTMQGRQTPRERQTPQGQSETGV